MTDEQKKYVRFGLARRIEHFLLILSFSTLGLTGLIQKYALSSISLWLVNALGGITTVRVIHRVAATIFVLEGVYHVIHLGYLLYVQRKEASMVPTIKDATDALQSFLHNLGFRKEAPKMPRYNFTEKLEYLAMVWGFIAMGLTGFMLWNPIATTRVLPGVVIPAAKAAHGLEAVLAVLAIILWHFYNVHIKHWNWAMIKGTLTHHEMEEEHAEELAKIETDVEANAEVDPKLYKKRMSIYTPVSIVLSIALVAAVIYFVTFEESAITTIEPVYADVDIYVPQTPTPFPTATPLPTVDPALANTWNGGIDTIFQTRCSLCHGENGGFAVTTYEQLLAGGDKGLALIPGNPEESLLLSVAAPGKDHPGQFSPDELTRVFEWIKNGAKK